MNTLAHPTQYIKAIWAAVTTFIGALITALVAVGDNASPSDLSWIAWLTIVSATLASFGGVFGLTNSSATSSE